MSLVALLAGEQHSDRPSTACPVITAFVIRINDAIDKPARQDLKDYAARIMGTDDGRHHDRAWLLTRKSVNDVFARMMESKGANGDAITNTDGAALGLVAAAIILFVFCKPEPAGKAKIGKR